MKSTKITAEYQGLFMSASEAWIKDAGMSQGEFANAIGLTQSRLSTYLDGRARPSFKIIQKIATGVGVDVATYMIGPETIPPIIHSDLKAHAKYIVPERRVDMGKVTKKWLKAFYWRAPDLVKASGVNRDVIYRLISGRTHYPTMTTLRALAKAVGVTPAKYLKGPATPKTSPVEKCEEPVILPPTPTKSAPIIEVMKAYDFMGILWNNLHLEFRVKDTENGTLVYVTQVPIVGMAGYIAEIKDMTELTPTEINEDCINGDHFELGYLL